MQSPCIFLKDSLRSSSLVGTLTHEAAHAMHLSIDDLFSKDWVQNFPKPPFQQRNEEQATVKVGMIAPYAAFDYVVDRDNDSITVPESQVWKAHVEREHIILTARTVRDPDTVVSLLQEHIQTLPGELRYYVPLVFVHPNPSRNGFFIGEGFTKYYERCCEDVAVHTEGFALAERWPTLHTGVLSMFRNHPLTRKRAHVLEEAGFLHEGTTRCLTTLASNYAHP